MSFRSFIHSVFQTQEKKREEEELSRKVDKAQADARDALDGLRDMLREIREGQNVNRR